MSIHLLTWIGIFICLSQSAILSGLNLGLFSLNRLELEVSSKNGDNRAKKILHLRKQANFALVTILWANVAVNVLLALLSGSVLTGLAAFLFSTVIITIFAEIIPQSYFSRHALYMAALLSPLLYLYQIILFPVARPTAWILDVWLGGEQLRYFKEKDLRSVIKLHMEAAESDIARVEGQGALNFLELDDIPMENEGERIDLNSVLELEFDNYRPIFPKIYPSPEDDFLKAVNCSGKSWVVIVNLENEPQMVLKADEFIREALFDPGNFNPYRHCHRPIIVRNEKKKLGELIQHFQVRSGDKLEDIIEDDIILVWSKQPRVITGTDILGRLLRGIARKNR